MRFRTDRRDVVPAAPAAASLFLKSALIGAAALLALLPAEALAATYRYASSSNRIYVENGGSTTLTAIKAALPGAPLEQTSPGVWLLRANLMIEDGALLTLHGRAIGGDVDELRLESDSGGFVILAVEYGTIDIGSTRIHSWNPSAGGVDTNHADGRAYLRARSYLDDDGVTPRESRMDIVNSEISHLGYFAAEAYGLVWKVIGKQAGLYDKVNVYGDIRNSRIHHNYFGIYTYGHDGGRWVGNEVHHNVKYGIDPHDDSDNLLIEDNDVHDNGNHGIIASKRCNNVVIRNNRSYGNIGNGIMLHRSSNDGLVEGNEAYLNTDSGIALFANKRSTVRNNILLDNGRAGIRLSMGEADSLIEGNEIGHAGKYGLYFYRGSDTPEAGDDGRPKRNTFRNNDVHDIAEDGIKMTDGDDNHFIGNSFRAIGNSMHFITSTGVRLDNNDIPAGTLIDVQGSPEVAATIDVYSQPLLQVALDDDSTAKFRDADNAIFDPDEAIYTTSSTTSSLLTLTRALIGTVSTVRTRALRAVPAAGKIRVDPSIWNTAGDLSKQWRVRADAGATSVAYSVGDLAPGVAYDVFRGSTRIATHTADSAGAIAFSSAPGTTSTVTYAVRPR